MAKIYSFTVPKNDNMMDRFDQIIKPVERSTAIRTILQYVIAQDPTFLRSLLSLPPIIEETNVLQTPQEIQ